MIFIALAVLFIFVLFLTNNTTIFKNQSKNGLVYNGNEKIQDLVNRDSDLDGVSDWKEGIYGTDPTKKDTNDDGIPDGEEIARMIKQNPEDGELNLNNSNLEDMSQTSQLSKEIFSTLATLNQAGEVDQDTIDKLSLSLADKLQNSTSIRTFAMSDIRISKTDTVQDVKIYNDGLNRIFNKYPLPGNTVFDVLDKFIIDEDTVDENALLELDPIIKQTDNLINEMVKLPAPPSLASMHLEFLNTLQKINQNVRDIKLYEADIVVAINGVNQYMLNTNILTKTTIELANTIEQKLP